MSRSISKALETGKRKKPIYISEHGTALGSWGSILLGTSEKCGTFPAPEVISLRDEKFYPPAPIHHWLRVLLGTLTHSTFQTVLLETCVLAVGCHWHVSAELVFSGQRYYLLHLIMEASHPSYPGHKVPGMRNSALLKEQFSFPESFFHTPIDSSCLILKTTKNMSFIFHRSPPSCLHLPTQVITINLTFLVFLHVPNGKVTPVLPPSLLWRSFLLSPLICHGFWKRLLDYHAAV